MPESRSCPKCGTAYETVGDAGLCPRCLLALNLDEVTDFGDLEDGPGGLPELPTPEELAKHFPQLEILQCLGRGGMGIVYQARQIKLDRLIALKILAPERGQDARFAERFAREAQTLARLNHPNVVTVYDFGQAGHLFYLLMEFVDGMNLRQLLNQRRLSSREALAIVPGVCEGLQYAHDQGVVHRDIKPENLLLDKHGHMKIADFGIARLLDAPAEPEPEAGEVASAASTTNNLTHSQVLGTPRYMAPEQSEQPSAVDHRADIYALGLVLYEMLTGKPPEQGVIPTLKGNDIDPYVNEVIRQALAREPNHRHQSAHELQTRLNQVGKKPKTGFRFQGWLTLSLGIGMVILILVIQNNKSPTARPPATSIEVDDPGNRMNLVSDIYGGSPAKKVSFQYPEAGTTIRVPPCQVPDFQHYSRTKGLISPIQELGSDVPWAGKEMTAWRERQGTGFMMIPAKGDTPARLIAFGVERIRKHLYDEAGRLAQTRDTSSQDANSTEAIIATSQEPGTIQVWWVDGSSSKLHVAATGDTFIVQFLSTRSASDEP